MTVAHMLQEFREVLSRLYGPRLRDVLLFGSYARGDFDSESDVDVLVVLDELANYGAEVDRTGPAVSELSLKYGVSISRVFVSEHSWGNKRTAFLDQVRSEAVTA